MFTKFSPQEHSVALLGLVLLMVITFAVMYLNSERLQYNKQFYPLQFSIDYLEFIRPGTKIRYQAALVVGTVESIESNLETHILHVKVKKGFFIPKKGSRITVQTWGYAGDKFINVDILEPYRHSEPYKSTDIIEMAKVSTFSGIMSTIDKTLKASEKSGKSVLEDFLETARQTTRQLADSQYAQPKATTHIIKKVSGTIITGLRKTLAFAKSTQQKMQTAKTATENIIDRLNRNLPLALKTVKNLKKFLSYKPNAKIAIEKGYLHEEATYYYMLSYLEYINQRLKLYKKEPSQLVFEGGIDSK